MAASDYVDQIQNLYIAYFGRPADPVGLAFWTEQVNAANGNLSAAIAGFATSTESGALYAGVSLGDKVTAIYQNLFNRAPEPAGLAFWVAKLVSGEISDAQAAYEILNAAGPGDTAAISNKLSVAKAFTAALDTPAEIAGYNGLTSAGLARSFLAKVDSTSFTLNQATSALNTTVAEATGTSPQTVTPAPAPAAFTATLDTNTQVVTFGGTATGDISVSWAGNDASFSRDSNKAAAVTFGGQGATSITLATGQALVATVADVSKLGDFIPNGGSLSIGGTGLVKLTDTTLQAATVKTLDTQVAPTLDLNSATRLSGTVADVITVKAGNGNTLNLANTLNLTVSDTVQNFETGKININATGTSDALTVTDSAQSALNLAAFTGFETITLNGSSATITLADGKATVSSTKAVDVQLGTGGQTFTGSSDADVVTTVSGGNTLSGGAGNDTFKLTNTTGSNTITDLATGDVLEVASGGTAVANNISSFVATAATVNNGTVTLNAALPGGTIDVSSATGSNGFTLNAGAGNTTLVGSVKSDVLIAGNGVDTLTGGAGDNVFQFANSQFKATDVAGLLASADTITDWTAAQSSNKIKFDTTTFSITAHTTPPVTGTASVDAQGLAAFDAGDTTLAQKLAAVVNVVGTDAVGTSVVFNDGADSYLFVVGDATAGVQAGDALIKLSGANGALALIGGDWVPAS
ncbi:DUF4214 domain-containing protein [Pseudomonas putida]|uniref:DUF4214 domain-containing protein n=1 Tax=Pseudomonas putida TaxID=303 RepID=UPI00370C3B5B